jgi:hypothetical protein
MILFFYFFETTCHYGETAYTYDLNITIIRSHAQGYLTTKNPVQCQAI